MCYKKMKEDQQELILFLHHIIIAHLQWTVVRWNDPFNLFIETEKAVKTVAVRRATLEYSTASPSPSLVVAVVLCIHITVRSSISSFTILYTHTGIFGGVIFLTQ